MQMLSPGEHLQVTLLERSIWNRVPAPMPSTVVMSAHGEYGDVKTGSRVYRGPGCAAAACRNPGWTVEHTLLATSATSADTLKLLQGDADLLRAHLKERYRQHLLPREGAVNIRVASIGSNTGYQIDSEVCALACSQEPEINDSAATLLPSKGSVLRLQLLALPLCLRNLAVWSGTQRCGAGYGKRAQVLGAV